MVQDMINTFELMKSRRAPGNRRRLATLLLFGLSFLWAQVLTAQTALPDLVPTSVSLSQNSVSPGFYISVSVTIANQGTATAGATTTTLRLNTSATTTSATDTRLTDIPTPSINAGGSTTVTASVLMPSGTAIGAYYIWAVADNYSAITQSNVSNDYGHSAVMSVVPPPSPPTLLSPSNGTTGVSTTPSFSWSTSSGASLYVLVVATDASFSNIILTQSTGSSTSYSGVSLASNTTYYWRVTASNSNGASTTSVSSFTTAQATPPVPVLSWPSNGSSGQAVGFTFSWSGSSGATSYGLQVSTDPSFGSYVLNTSGIPTNAYTISGLTYSSTYYWRVNASNSGGTSSWSGAWNFTTVPPTPAPPTLSSPSAGTTNVSVSPTLSWIAPSGTVAWYWLEVSTDPGFTSSFVVNYEGVYSTNYALGGLSNSTTYYWRVAASNGYGGGIGAWSTTGYFTTIPGAPTASTSAATNITSSAASLNGVVNPNGASTSYYFQYGTTTSYGNVSSTGSAGSASAGLSVSATVTGLAAATTYHSRIVATSIGGTAYGGDMTFSTLSGPPAAPQSLAAIAGSGEAILTWHKNSEADLLRYRIYYSTISGAEMLLDSTLSGANDTTSVISNLVNGKTYYFKVTAVNSSALESQFSNEVSVQPSRLNSLGEYNPDSSTVLLLHMDETSGNFVGDASGSNRNGISYGDGIASGKFGQARSISVSASDSGIVIDSPLGVSEGAPVTLEAWVKISQYGNAATFLVSNSDYQLNLGSFGSSGYLQMFRKSGSSWVFAQSTVPVPLNLWTHVAGEWDGSSFSLWINGQNVPFNITTNAYSYTGGSRIASSFGNTVTPTSTSIEDEVRISARARLPQEFNLQLTPLDLAANCDGNKVTITWQNGGGAAPLLGYRVYRGTDSTNVSLIDSTTNTAVSDELPGSGKFYYRISAVDSSGFESGKSYAASVVSFPDVLPSASWSRKISGTNSNLRGIAFIDSNRGVAVGEGGAIVRTTNGGTVWTQVTGVTTSNLSAVTDVADTFWACGDGGTLIKSTDGGASWVPATSGVTVSLNDISFVDNDTGWVAQGDGDGWLKTTDGGRNWSFSSTGAGWWMKRLRSADGRNLIFTGDGPTVLRSTNGGRSWNNMPTSLGGNPSVTGLFLVDSRDAWATGGNYGSGNGFIIRSDDSGSTWQQVVSSAANHYSNVAFVSPKVGYVIGWGGTLLETGDSGISWATSNSTTHNNLSGIAAVGPNVWIVGDSGTILESSQRPTAPRNLAAVAGNGLVTLTWNKNTEPDILRYRLYRGTISGGETLVDSTTTGIYDTSRVESGLINGTTYYFYVTAVDSAGLESVHSNEVSAIPPGLPVAPVLVYPGQGLTAVNTPAVLRWHPAPGAVSYEVEVSSDSSFNSIAYDFQSLTDTSVVIQTLKEFSDYYWRTMSSNSSGSSEWSPTWKFTSGVPSKTNVALASRGAVASAISEGTYNGVTQYASHAIDGDSTTIWADEWSMPAWLLVKFDSTYTISTLGFWITDDSQHVSLSLSPDSISWTTVVSPRWSQNKEGSTTPVHELFQISDTKAKYIRMNFDSTFAPSGHIFQAILSELEAYSTQPAVASLPRPILVSPANGSNGVAGSMILTWRDDSGATSYRIQLAYDSTITTILLDTSIVAGTSVSIQHLLNLKQYYWRVSATGPTGTSQWSDVWSFATGLTPPIVSVTEVHSTSVTLSWPSVGGASKYYIYFGLDSSKVSKIDSTNGTSYTMIALSGGTPYLFAVSSAAGPGVESETSMPIRVTTRLSPPEVRVTPAKGPSMNISWYAVPGAVSYSVFRSVDGKMYSGIASATGAAFSDLSVKSAKRYWYFVLAVGPGGEAGDTSNTVDTLSYPSTPGYLTASEITDWQVSLSWAADSGIISGYRIYRSSDSTNYTIIGSTIKPSFSDTGLVALTSYLYKVSAINTDSMESDGSTPFAVTTPRAAPRIVSFFKSTSAARDSIVFADSCYVPPGDTAKFRFLYSLDNGRTYDTARAVTSSKTSAAESFTDLVSWSSRIDAPGAESDSTVFRAVPYSRYGDGTSRQTLDFLLDNAAPRFRGIDSAAAGDNKVTLSWNRAKDLSSHLWYLVYVSETPGMENLNKADSVTPDTSLTFGNMKNFQRYFFIVRARDSVGNVDTNRVELSAVPQALSALTSISGPAAPQDGDIRINYDVNVSPQDTIRLDCYFSSDSGRTFIKAAGVSGRLSGITHSTTDSLIWNSRADFHLESRGVLFKIIPVGLAGAGASAVTDTFTVDNKPPVFGGISAISAGANSLILSWRRGIDLSSPLQYYVYASSLSKAENFSVPSRVVSDTSTVIGQLDNFRMYYFIVRARDALGNIDSNANELSGVPVAIPVVTHLEAPASPSSGDIPISYSVSVPSQDSASLNCYFSSDSGKTYRTTASIAGQITAIGVNKSDTLVWHSSKDYRGESRSVRFKIIPVGRGGTGNSVSTGSFTVDNQPPGFIGVASQEFVRWSSERIILNRATDMSEPVSYGFYLQKGDTFNLAKPDTVVTSDSLLLHGLPALTSETYIVRATDSLGNQDTNTVENTFSTPAIGGFTGGSTIGTADLGEYINAWSNGATSDADLAPFTGSFPHITVVGDNRLNANDLVVFAKMWDYSLNANMLKRDGSSPSVDATLPRPVPLRLNVNKSTRMADLTLSPGVGTTLMSCGVRIYYGTLHTPKGGKVTVDSVFFADGGLTLTFNDTVNKVIYLDYGKVGGYGVGPTPATFVRLNVPEFGSKDSMSISLVGYDSNMDRVIANAYAVEVRNIPTTFNLYQNYPNPFNPTTTIQFDLPKAERVTVTIYNILGQRVTTVVDKPYDAGTYTVLFNAGRYASGAYFCVMQAGKYRSVKKMMLIK